VIRKYTIKNDPSKTEYVRIQAETCDDEFDGIPPVALIPASMVECALRSDLQDVENNSTITKEPFVPMEPLFTIKKVYINGLDMDVYPMTSRPSPKAKNRSAVAWYKKGDTMGCIQVYWSDTGMRIAQTGTHYAEERDVHWIGWCFVNFDEIPT